MPKKRKPIKVIEKKLGREKVVGLCFQQDNLLMVDPTQSSKEYLCTLVHELLHYSLVDLSEEEVIRCEDIIGNTLWEQGYRKVHL